MTNHEIMKLANAEAPVMMGRTASLLADLEANSPYLMDEVIGDFHQILDQVRQGVEKNASVGSVITSAAKSLGRGAKAAATSEPVKRLGYMAAAGLGVALATDLYDAARRGLTKGGNMKRILDANPDLKKQVRDQRELYTAFDTLHRFAPELTADPMLGGAMLMQMVGMPAELRVKVVQDLIKSRQSVIDSKNNQFALNPIELLSKRPDSFKTAKS